MTISVLLRTYVMPAQGLVALLQPATCAFPRLAMHRGQNEVDVVKPKAPSEFCAHEARNDELCNRITTRGCCLRVPDQGSVVQAAPKGRAHRAPRVGEIGGKALIGCVLKKLIGQQHILCRGRIHVAADNHRTQSNRRVQYCTVLLLKSGVPMDTRSRVPTTSTLGVFNRLEYYFAVLIILFVYQGSIESRDL
jgi:hypothetical protein